MRLVRIGALVGSVVLLVATTVSAFNARAALRNDQDAGVTAAVLIADQSVDAAIRRALALVDAAVPGTEPTALVRSFPAGADACVDSRCTGADLLALPSFGPAAATSAGAGGTATAVVDAATDTLLVVARNDINAVLQLPPESLLDVFATSAAADFGASMTVSFATTRMATSRAGPENIDGERVVTDTIALPDDAGTVVVSARLPDEVGFTGDNLALYVVLLALGTLLMGLAAWTFLLERRSLERRATTDDLTGLVNRREFERLADESLLAADRFSTGVCVMLIDLNGFKQINDTLGHEVGDRVLQSAAHRLRDAVRDTDAVGRWGGDEFVILLPGLQDGTAVRNSAERIGRQLGGTPIVDDVRVTAAIGAALFPRHGDTLDALVRAADVAMYEAKSTGVTYRLASTAGDPDAHHVLATDYRGPDRRRGPTLDRT